MRASPAGWGWGLGEGSSLMKKRQVGRDIPLLYFGCCAVGCVPGISIPVKKVNTERRPEPSEAEAGFLAPGTAVHFL